MDDMHRLIIRSSKFSFLLMFILALPIILETEPILKLWLKIVPDYGVTFVRLMLISTLFELLSGTLVYGALATGRIRNYQAILSSILFSEVICVYVAYKCGMAPQVMFYIEMVLYCICLVVRLLLLRKMIGLSIRIFLKSALLPEAFVVLVSVPLSMAVYTLLPPSIIGCVVVIVVSLLIGVASAFCLGLDKKEKTWALERAKVFINRIINK